MRNLQIATLSILAAWCAPGLGQSLEEPVRKRVETGLANWVKASKTAITTDAQSKLLADVAAARKEVKQRNPNVKQDALDAATPRAVVTYLDRSADNKESAPLAALIEQTMYGTGAVLKKFTDYPTLLVKVTPDTPADFVVTIGTTSYAAGASKFRVNVGEAEVKVSRGGSQPCSSKIKVTSEGPNVLVCTF